MIGVVFDETRSWIVEELFELFKIAWEPASAGRRYSAVIGPADAVGAFDTEVHLVLPHHRQDAAVAMAQFRGRRFPLYRGSVPTAPGGAVLVTVSGRAAVTGQRLDVREVWEFGYDLFGELEHLLSAGQPSPLGEYPTAELHVSVLREVLAEAGVDYIEVPPRPAGADFICCLTHDIDFFGLRRHRLDRTLAGFVSRASLGSVRDAVRGRRSVGEALTNLRTTAVLPLIFAGLARDPWEPFEAYAAVEQPGASTFFLVPFAGRPGTAPDGSSDPARAVRYRLSDAAPAIRGAGERGCELGLHGIDAWRDRRAALEERMQLGGVLGHEPAGVRMHWLYFDRQSPIVLDNAGFDYDSTWGYNDTVGFRAGTLQPVRLQGTTRLLELPLAVMDSALFSGRRLGLGPDEAADRCRPLVEDARRFGGALVINWHDRSLAPERLWGRAYGELLGTIQKDGRAWFTTASQAVAWHRWRRSLRITAEGRLATVAGRRAADRGGTVRVHRNAVRPGLAEDLPFDGANSLTTSLLSPAPPFSIAH
jgi:hypothetical protein